MNVDPNLKEYLVIISENTVKVTIAALVRDEHTLQNIFKN